MEGEREEITALDMWLVPLGAVLAFIILFWAVRGLKALKEMKAFPKAA
jgi:hypothetical protein